MRYNPGRYNTTIALERRVGRGMVPVPSFILNIFWIFTIAAL
jgi:hypothetical protein